VARRIAVVPQVYEAAFPFRVREIVALGRTAHLGPLGAPSARDARAIDRALAELGLAALAERRIDRISGGERQRAILGMALAQEPEVLLLDEPTLHLDPPAQRETLALVRGLVRARALVAVAVLHDLNLAATFGDRIVGLRAGKVLRDGPPDEVIRPENLAALFGPGLVVGQHDGRPFVLPSVTLESDRAS
jgi:ABC-type cobalamin/Fe3+-siderophores transport system ATPase subunit